MECRRDLRRRVGEDVLFRYAFSDMVCVWRFDCCAIEARCAVSTSFGGLAVVLVEGAVDLQLSRVCAWANQSGLSPRPSQLPWDGGNSRTLLDLCCVVSYTHSTRLTSIDVQFCCQVLRSMSELTSSEPALLESSIFFKLPRELRDLIYEYVFWNSGVGTQLASVLHPSLLPISSRAANSTAKPTSLHWRTSTGASTGPRCILNTTTATYIEP